MKHGDAQRRGVRSFYRMADEPWPPPGLVACRGLSCELHGAAALAARLGPAAQVSCLGHCHRSPALLTGEGEAFWAPEPAGIGSGNVRLERAEAPSVLCLARRRVVTERLGTGPCNQLDVARRAGVYGTLAKVVSGTAGQVLAAVEASGERGRGGAGFATGRKWRACAATDADRRYVVANGDEGDPGSYIDRLLMEDDPHAVIEGLLISAFAVGATDGIIFVRGEYPRARNRLEQALVEAREAGLVGNSILGSTFGCDVRVVSGHGSYVCGEETALLNAIEGRRGEARPRPPYPVARGLHGFPTVVNNVETLVNIPWILREGADAFRALGTVDSPGTKVFCLNRGFARPGIVEAEFGITLDELVNRAGGGAADGGPLRAVALGGPMGSIVFPVDFNLELDPSTLLARGIRLGHGGVVAIPAAADPAALLLHWARFMAEESCGRCAPCALGSRRILDWAVGLQASPARDHSGVGELLDTIETASLCGFGQGIVAPLRTLVAMAVQAVNTRRVSE